MLCRPESCLAPAAGVLSMHDQLSLICCSRALQSMHSQICVFLGMMAPASSCNQAP